MRMDSNNKPYWFNGIASKTLATVDDITHGYQLFTESGTFIVPDHVTALKVTCVGGAGGGGGGNAGETSGGYGATGYINSMLLSVTAGESHTVTVGSGGAGGVAVTAQVTNAPAGSSGGVSSFGSLVSASGGEGGGGARWVEGGSYSAGSPAFSWTRRTGMFFSTTRSVGGVGGTYKSSGAAGTSGIVLVEW